MQIGDRNLARMWQDISTIRCAIAVAIKYLVFLPYFSSFCFPLRFLRAFAPLRLMGRLRVEA